MAISNVSNVGDLGLHLEPSEALGKDALIATINTCLPICGSMTQIASHPGSPAMRVARIDLSCVRLAKRVSVAQTVPGLALRSPEVIEDVATSHFGNSIDCDPHLIIHAILPNTFENKQYSQRTL